MRTNTRRGSVYVAILGLSVLVAVIGLGGVLLSRTQSRVADLQNDIREARSYALSAIEIGRSMIYQDVNWRTTYSNGTWVNNQPFGEGRISLSVVNPSGLLNRSAGDSVVLTATGTKGNAVQTVQVTLDAVVIPCTSLNTALTANAITLNGSKILGTSVTMASVTNIIGGSGTWEPDVESAGTIIGVGYTGQFTQNAVARTMPDPAHVFDHYIANGTTISLSALPMIAGNYQVSGIVLSPAANPYGPANSQGIYVIDCGGANIVIENSRVVGTLVLLNTGAGSIIQGSDNISSAVANYPCLLVRGPMTFAFAGTLAESATLNFNPPGTPYPYPGGTTNTSTSESYPSFIGLAYISGNVAVTSNNVPFKNLIVGGTFNSNDTTGTTLSFTNSYYASPPPGFFSCKMMPATASWKQVVN